VSSPLRSDRRLVTPRTTLLVTGFEAFDGHAINVSWEVARTLQRRAATVFPEVRMVAAKIPCRFGECIDEVVRLIREVHPDLVICLGQAEGRSQITVERVALNVRDARIADNRGQRPTEEAVIPGGPYAYPSRLPVAELVAQLRADGHQVAASYTAGTFVCNDLFYGLMHHLERTPIAGGFIHLPILPEQQRSDEQRSTDREDAPRTIHSVSPAMALSLQVGAIDALITLTLRLTGQTTPHTTP